MCDALGAVLNLRHYFVFEWIGGFVTVVLLYKRAARQYLLAYRVALGISLPLYPETAYFAIAFRSWRDVNVLNRRGWSAIFREQHNDQALESRRLKAVWLFRLLILAMCWPQALFVVVLVLRGLLNCAPIA